MNTHEKDSAKTIHRIAPIATALSVMLLAACSVPVQVPVQTKPQGESSSAFVDQLKQSLPVPAKPAAGKSELPGLAPAIVPAPAELRETLPAVVWPARGAGDFETATAALPFYWYTVGVDDRELLPPVAAPASIQAREDLRDRHPSLFESAPAAPQKAGEDAIDRHPSPNVIAPSVGQVVDDDFMGRHTRRPPAAPAAPQKAGEDLRDRHPQLAGGEPRVNLRADDLLNGPDLSANRAPTPSAEPMDDMWYRDASRNER